MSNPLTWVEGGRVACRGAWNSTQEEREPPPPYASAQGIAMTDLRQSRSTNQADFLCVVFCHTASAPIASRIFAVWFLVCYAGTQLALPLQQERIHVWFLVWYAATRLATQLQQRCTKVVCSNTEARKRLTESNGTPAMDLGQTNIDLTDTFAYCFEVDIRIRRHTNRREIKQNTNAS